MATPPIATPKVTVLETSQVAPPPGSVVESSFPLTFIDIKLLFSSPVERIFFFKFPHSTSHFLHSVLPSLKSSLSLTLQRFSPLAGKIRRSPEIEDGGLEINYVEGYDFVELTAAEIVSDEFEGLCTSHARDINKLLVLLPQLPNTGENQPLLASQATVFPHRGIAIGVVLHHAVCDGSGFTHFISSWATAFRGGSTSGKPPVLDRTMIFDPHGLRSIYFKALSSLAGIIKPTGRNSNSLGDQNVIATFNLTGDVIQKLKGLLQAKADTSLHISSITVTYAYVWISLVKTRRLEADKMAYLIFPADCRSSLKPPVPETYFGNCLSGCLVKLMTGDLLDGRDGFVNAAVAVGQAIKRFKEMDVLSEDEKMTKTLLPIMSERPMLVGGSPKFRVYEIDFGWGRPEKVEMTSIRNRGAISVQESREGRGGIEVGLVLPIYEMDEFARNFSNGLNFL